MGQIFDDPEKEREAIMKHLNNVSKTSEPEPAYEYMTPESDIVGRTLEEVSLRTPEIPIVSPLLKKAGLGQAAVAMYLTNNPEKKTLGEIYRAMADREEKSQEQFAEANPKQAMAKDIAGGAMLPGVSGPLKAMGGASKLAELATKAANLGIEITGEGALSAGEVLARGGSVEEALEAAQYGGMGAVIGSGASKAIRRMSDDKPKVVKFPDRKADVASEKKVKKQFALKKYDQLVSGNADPQEINDVLVSPRRYNLKEDDIEQAMIESFKDHINTENFDYNDLKMWYQDVAFPEVPEQEYYDLLDSLPQQEKIDALQDTKKYFEDADSEDAMLAIQDRIRHLQHDLKRAEGDQEWQAEIVEELNLYNNLQKKLAKNITRMSSELDQAQENLSKAKKILNYVRQERGEIPSVAEDSNVKSLFRKKLENSKISLPEARQMYEDAYNKFKRVEKAPVQWIVDDIEDLKNDLIDQAQESDEFYEGLAELEEETRNYALDEISRYMDLDTFMENLAKKLRERNQ